MRNPTYLELSRHRVYYFRFPVPQPITPANRSALSVKVSLQTRMPKEALYLSRLLRYSGDILAKRLATTDMRYDEIRSVLKAHFQTLLQRRKDEMAEHGRLSRDDVASVRNGIAFGKQAIATGRNISHFETDDDLVARFVELHKLALVPGTKAHDTFKVEMRKAYTDYCSAVLAHDKAFDRYDLTSVAAPIADSQTEALATGSTTLRKLAEKFIGEETLAGRWAPRSEDQKRQHIQLLQEALGAEKLVNRLTAEARQSREWLFPCVL